MTDSHPQAATVHATVGALLDRVASQDPAPGGGSVSALAGALGAALCAMVSRLTAAKASTGEPGDGRAGEVVALVDRLDALSAALAEAVDRDAAAYEGVIAAMRLPRETDAQKAARREAIQAATRVATDVPLETARLCAEVMRACLLAAREGFPGAVTDAGVGLLMSYAGVNGALYNVEINLGGSAEGPYEQAVRAEAASLRELAADLMREGDAEVRRRL